MNEPLRRKKRVTTGLTKDEFFLPTDVKSAVEFYKEYRWHNRAFESDFPELYKEFNKTQPKSQTALEWLYAYEVWLFDYCFGDVIE